MHCLYRPNIVMRTLVISRRLILQGWRERFSGGLGERDAGTTSFRCWDSREFLRVQMHTKRRRKTTEPAWGVTRLYIAVRKMRRCPESEQRKERAHEQQDEAD